MQIPAQVPAQVKVPASQPTRVFELNRRRIYIMPTRHGIAFAISVAVMLVGSVNYANSLGYLLTFLLASVGLVSLLHTYRNLAGLSIRMSDPQPVFAGNGLAIPLAIDNRKGAERIAVSITHPAAISARPSRKKWRIQWRRARAPLVAQSVSIHPQSLQAHAITVQAEQRGVFALTEVVVASRFPLGLFRAWSRLHARHLPAPVRCYVYPRLQGNPHLPSSGAEDPRSDGRAGKGHDDFAGLRDYQRGDPPKHIHWKAVARGQGLPVKEFAGDGNTVVNLSWADTEHLADPEARLSQLACWIVEAQSQGLFFGLTLPDHALPVGSGAAHGRRALNALAEFPS